ncbi:MAG: hypothetical protein LQ352_001700 [Teloschistes flavicans]|nr:MAG: hypothetical protein LQ352_001700 [Teloschistes flavicans]
MAFTLPQSRLYALAEQARTKFSEAANAKDQHLSRLLAHAHLYDELDDHFEKLRLDRMSGSTCPPFQALPVPIVQDVSRPQEQQDEDNNGCSDDTAKGTLHKWDLINECAILDDEEEDVPPPPSCSHEGPLVVNEQVAPVENNRVHPSIHASPAEFQDTSVNKSAQDMYSTTTDSQITISEQPIDDDDDSDSESDSDCDTLVDQDEQTAISISISRPKTSYHDLESAIDLDLASKPFDDLDESNSITNNDAFPALERSKPSSQLPPSYDSPSASPSRTRNQSSTSLKTPPLSPLLCDSSTCADVSSTIYQDLLLHQVLHRLLRPYLTANDRTASEEQRDSPEDALLRLLRSGVGGKGAVSALGPWESASEV